MDHFEARGSWLANVPIVAHVPHAGRDLPPNVRKTLSLSDAALELEILRVTDHFTDELSYGILELGGIQFVNQLSRLVVDPERFRHDGDELMAARGAGAVYVVTTGGQRLRAPDLAESRESLLQTYFDPYARAMTDTVGRILSRWDRCLVLDMHSYPSKPFSYELRPTDPRPDICFGTDDFHTPLELLEAMELRCDHWGFSTARNQPFFGCYVPLAFHRRDRHVSGLMIEIRRDLYMDEPSGRKNERFSEIRVFLSSLLELATCSMR